MTIVFGRKNIQMFKAGICKTQYESIGMLLFFSVVILGFFLLVGGMILCKYEEWTFLESVYFIWVSSCTIGFGDYAPKVGERFNIIYLVLVLVGWHIIAFVISVLEVTLGVFSQMHWWSENHLIPWRNSTSSTQALVTVVRESDGHSEMVEASSLLLTPQRKKRM